MAKCNQLTPLPFKGLSKPLVGRKGGGNLASAVNTVQRFVVHPGHEHYSLLSIGRCYHCQLYPRSYTRTREHCVLRLSSHHRCRHHSRRGPTCVLLLLLLLLVRLLCITCSLSTFPLHYGVRCRHQICVDKYSIIAG